MDQAWAEDSSKNRPLLVNMQSYCSSFMHSKQEAVFGEWRPTREVEKNAFCDLRLYIFYAHISSVCLLLGWNKKNITLPVMHTPWTKVQHGYQPNTISPMSAVCLRHWRVDKHQVSRLKAVPPTLLSLNTLDSLQSDAEQSCIVQTSWEKQM